MSRLSYHVINIITPHLSSYHLGQVCKRELTTGF